MLSILTVFNSEIVQEEEFSVTWMKPCLTSICMLWSSPLRMSNRCVKSCKSMFWCTLSEYLQGKWKYSASFQALSAMTLVRSNANWWLRSQLVQHCFRWHLSSKWWWSHTDGGTFKGAEVYISRYSIPSYWSSPLWGFCIGDWQHQCWQKISFHQTWAYIEPFVAGQRLSYLWGLWSKLVLQGLRWELLLVFSCVCGGPFNVIKVYLEQCSVY